MASGGSGIKEKQIRTKKTEKIKKEKKNAIGKIVNLGTFSHHEM